MKRLLTILSLFIIVAIQAQNPGFPGVDAGTDQTIDCSTGSSVTLTASFLETGDTTSYSVDAITYPADEANLPVPYYETTTTNAVTTDDVWSGIIEVGFNFCFFGDVHNQLIAGSNGQLCFDLAEAGSGSGYSLNTSDLLPTTTSALDANSIFGVMHDIDISVNNSNPERKIAYTSQGTAPFRTFVATYNDVAHYGSSCASSHSTFEMVLYEATNVIEVYIKEKPACTSWNDGLAVLGIQNQDASVAYTPPGRNTGVWTATNEAWRFTPNGAPNWTIEWTDSSGTVVGNTAAITVSPTADEVYTATVKYTNCDNTVVSVTDDVAVTIDTIPPTLTNPGNMPQCDTDTDGFMAFDLASNDSTIVGAQAGLTVTYHASQADADAGTNSLLSPYTNTSNPQTIYIRLYDPLIDCFVTDTFDLIVNVGNPTANQPSDMTSCINAAGQGDFDLRTQDAAILGAQSAADYTVHYYSDAAHTTEITVMPYTAPDATTIYAQVVDNLCSTTADTTFVLHVIPNTTVTAINPAVFCNGDTTGVLVFTSPDAGVVFNWTNDTPAIGLAASGTGDLPSFTATNTSNAAVIAAITVTPEITVNGLTCQGTPESFTITVNPTPAVDAIANPAPYCTGDATAAIVFTGNGVAGTTYNWVNTGDDIGMGAMAGSGDIASFNTVNTGTTVLTATIEVTPSTASCTGATESFTITVNPNPTVDAVTSQTLCTSDNTAAINFTGNAVAGVSYEWTNDNTAIGLAATGTGNIPSFTTTNTTNGQLVANIMVTPVANGCSGTPENFTITVNPTPTVDAIASPAPYCTGDATAAIVFTGNGVAGTTYNWVNTGDDIGMGAMAGSGDITSFNTVNIGTTVLTATIEVTPNAGCTGATETFTITVNPMPTVDAVNIPPLCNGDNLPVINFTGNAVAGVSYEWTNDNTAIGLSASGTGDIASYTVVNTTTTPIVAHLTVTPVANGCSGNPENFTITINGTPDSVIPGNQQDCDDDNDGFLIFDLTQDETTILNGQDSAIFDVLYYSDAAYTMQIANPATYQNSLAYQPDTIYPQVINTNTGCMSTPNAGFTVEVFATPYIANAVANQTLCDNDDMINAGSADFDLNALIPDLLGTQATDPDNAYNVTFHLTQPDADAGANPMAIPYNLLTGDEISVFVRIENAGLSTCANTSLSFTIHTYDSPVLTMDPSYPLCLNQGFVTVTSPPFTSYQWLDSSDVVLGTNQSYDFTAGGNYALVVNNADGCTDRADFVIEDSENPVITDVIYTEFTDNNTIKVFVAGAITNTIVDIDHFEYALDNGPYQDSNVFEGVTPGVHHVVVRDKNGCGETVPYEVVVLGYMPFFTPNGDGDHDIWRVTALQYFPDSKLYIYDRQGKLINTFTETDAGWNGMYNGHEEPSTDYWFLLKLRDGRAYRRHFSLKR